MQQRNRRPALTLLELILVLAGITLLIALLVPAAQKVRASAARAQCANQLKQIGLACHTVHDQFKRMPPAFGFFPNNDITSGTDGLGTVFFHLLPAIDQQALYQQSHYQPSVAFGRQQQDFFFYTANDVQKTQVPLFNCPSDPTLQPGFDATVQAAPSSYAANYLVFGNVDPNFANANAQGKPRLAVTFADGTSNTLLFAEKYASASISAASNGGTSYKGGCHWAYFQADCQNPLIAYYDPALGTRVTLTDPNAVGPGSGLFQVQPRPQGGCNPCLPATGHSAMNVCMADGSVRPLASDMDRRSWWALMTPAGGECVDAN